MKLPDYVIDTRTRNRLRKPVPVSGGVTCNLVKGKCKCIYFCSTRKALGHGSHNLTCNYTNACLYFISVHQMATSQTEVTDI